MQSKKNVWLISTGINNISEQAYLNHSLAKMLAESSTDNINVLDKN